MIVQLQGGRFCSMIFLRRESFKSYIRSYPGITAIVGICIVYYLFTWLGGYLTNGYTIYSAGAFLSVPQEDPVGLSQPWRYLTSMFMHADFYHLLHNMAMLIIFGPPLERLIQTKRFIPFYLLSGIGGTFIASLIYSMLGKGQLTVGASGAIYGVFGAYLFIALFRKKMVDEQSIQTIYMILVIGIVSSIVITTTNLWGHIGGLITGLLLYRIFDQLHIRKQYQND